MHLSESSGFQLLSQKGLIPHKLKPGSLTTCMFNDLYLCTTASEQDVEEKNEREMGERGGEGKRKNTSLLVPVSLQIKTMSRFKP